MPDALFRPFELGSLSLPNRIVMAPMTRCRTSQPGDRPNRMMAAYYAQRATAGLIVTEATQISPQGQGYSFTPGIYSSRQIDGWRSVTEAVHRAGGRIFLQLWHVGRMSHVRFHGGQRPVAPSALPPRAQVWVADPVTGKGEPVACPVPRALEAEEIPGLVEDFRRAAANATAAEFDGVELHAANGYLIDQFLRRSANRRSDGYGGSRDRRLRFLREVAEAVAAEVGAERMGVRLSPFITARGMQDDEIVETTLSAARALDVLGAAYIHLAEADWDDEPSVPERFREELRRCFRGAVIVAGTYDRTRADEILTHGQADLVAFGRPFLANPDLPRRLAEDLPLAAYDPALLYGGGARGYSDYPPYRDADAGSEPPATTAFRA